MQNINIAPTRQELMRLRNKQKSAKRGHKLLKDKRDNLIQTFMSIYRDAIDMRKKVDKNYSHILNRFDFAMLEIDESYLDLLAEDPNTNILIDLEVKNTLGVKLPELSVEVTGNFLNYSLAETNYHLDVSLSSLREILPDMLKLIELEFKVRKLASEIEKTRRRVNALEYVIIPQLGKQIKYIRAKLEEDALQTTVRLMKMKQKLSD